MNGNTPVQQPSAGQPPPAAASLLGRVQQQPIPAQPTQPMGPTPSSIPVHSEDQTHQPDHPNFHFTTDAPRKLSENEWSAISQDLFNSVNASITARSTFEANLKEWSDAYAMIQQREEKDWPWQNSSNSVMPYSASQLESLVAYIAGTALPPRVYIVTGNTPMAAENAFKVEKFYNAEFLRLRSDGSSYFQRHIDLIHMGLRDGTAIMEVLWNRRRQRKRSVAYKPKLDDGGIPVFGEDGHPQWEPVYQDVDVFVKDYPEMMPVRIKDFGLIPDEAPSIEAAAAVWKTEWLYEDQLDRMVRAGNFDSGETEKALSMWPSGVNAVASDQQGYYDKTASEQISIGQGQGSLTSKFFRNRGPLNVKRVHSRQFDMNGDGIPEENIFWLDWTTKRMLGWIPYEYGNQMQRPFFSWCPFPRPDEFLGFSLIERLAGVQIDIDSMKNQRRDQVDLRLNPPWAVESGSELLNKKGIWGPARMIEVERVGGPQPTYAVITVPDVPVSSYQEESTTRQYGDDYTGLQGPMIGVQSTGRRSATESRQRSAAAGTRLNIIATRLRVTAGQVINFVHALNKQYLTQSPSTIINQQLFTLSLDDLSQDYTIGIVGSTDPIDSATRRNEALSLFQLITPAPDIQGDPVRMFYWRRSVLEAFNRGAEIDKLIGTEQDAQNMSQQLAMQRAQAGNAAQQESITSDNPGGPPNESQPRPQ